MNTKYLVVIVGPTGSGKSDLAINIAERYGAPIISTDSRQFYRGIPIGTAQPDEEQLQRAEHHFIASHDLKEEFNCGAYETAALAKLTELYSKHNVVVAVGGSGLYIKALCEGMDSLPEAKPELREQLARRLEQEGLESLCEELKERDTTYYNEVDRQNPARVLRALEVCITTGLPYSSLRTGRKQKRDFEIIKIGVAMERDKLYERIDKRVLKMMEQGLEQEARAVYHLRGLNSLQTVGYKEMFDYFDGKLTIAQAIELIQRNSRRYAKRQMTWFRRDEDIWWANPSDMGAIEQYLDTKICTLK